MGHKRLVRDDFVFSYWIFAWFLLYFFKCVDEAPKGLLIVGLFFNLLTGAYSFFIKPAGSPLYNKIKYCIINFCIKVLPLLYLWNRKITRLEIVISALLIVSYFFWIFINDTNPMEIYRALYASYTEKGPRERTFPSQLYDTIYQQIVKMGHSFSQSIS
jgi:hypothetical protein